MGCLVAEAEAAHLPPEAWHALDLRIGQFTGTKARTAAITAALRRAAEGDETARQLQI